MPYQIVLTFDKVSIYNDVRLSERQPEYYGGIIKSRNSAHSNANNRRLRRAIARDYVGNYLIKIMPTALLASSWLILFLWLNFVLFLFALMQFTLRCFQHITNASKFLVTITNITNTEKQSTINR